METSESIAKLAEALAAAQGEMESAGKNKLNPAFKSRYADLASCWDAVREPLAKHGLAVVQGAAAEGAKVTITTLLMHASGEWVRDALTLTARDASVQAVCSAITYGRRYGLSSIAGISQDDDDGEAPQGRSNGNGRREAPREQPAAPPEMSANEVKLEKGKVLTAFANATTLAGLTAASKAMAERIRALPNADREFIREEYMKRLAALKDAEPVDPKVADDFRQPAGGNGQAA